MIDWKTFFDQLIKNDLTTYENIQKISTGQEDNYTIGYVLDYNCFQNYYKMIAIDINKQQALDVDPKQYNKLNLLEIQKNNQRYFSLLKKQKKLF